MGPRSILLAALLALSARACRAQDVPAPQEQGAPIVGAIQRPRVAEPGVDGLVRAGEDTLAVTVPGKRLAPGVTAGPLLLSDFDFEGVPVATGKLHLKQLSPGVLEITSLAYTTGLWRFHVADAASYFGLGERFDVLDHTHQVLKNASEDNPGPKGTSTYKPMPFFMSTTGYGLWVDTTADATFDMNASSPSDVIVDVVGPRLRVVVLLGPSFPLILERFTALAGRAVLPPYWAFAPWKARDYHQNQAQVKEDVDRMRALGLPASVLLIDSPWTTSYNSYKFNPRQFDDAPAMVKFLHGEGYKLVLWHTSWINSKSDPPHEAGFEGKMSPLAENYAEAAAHGYFVKRPDGSPYVGRWWKGLGSLIDFTNPAAKRWWQDQVRLAIAAGADGFKDDDAEGSFLGDVQFADQTDPRVMRNKYAVLYNNAVEELVQQDLKGNGVLFARSVTQGANGLGFLWGGDNEASFSPANGLPTAVTAGLGAGLSGMPLWTSDLGGYEKTSTTPDPQLLMRWTEYSAFSPVMEVMSSANIGPWDFDNRTGGTRALDNYRKYSVLHMSLFPYRYAAAQQAARTGMPLMRALVLDYQDDLRARATRDEYLFGPDLLVAPVVDENLSRVVYLPAGDWIDFWTGEASSGPRTLVANAPLETLPLWVRAGAVIARIPDDIMTLVPAAESGNTTVKSLDNRRLYDLYPPGASGSGSSLVPVSMEDFEGRTLTRDRNSLKLSGGKPAHILLCWKFSTLESATLDGAPLTLDHTGNQTTAEFDYNSSAAIGWK